MKEGYRGIDPCLGMNYRVEQKPTQQKPERSARPMGDPEAVKFWRGAKPIPEGYKAGPVFV